VLACLVGCAAQARSPEGGARWVQASGTNVPLDVARQQCADRATQSTSDLRTQDVATKAALGDFIACMREQGWTKSQ
jgi:hypothetical protein